jgi:hypothetical protein
MYDVGWNTLPQVRGGALSSIIALRKIIGSQNSSGISLLLALPSAPRSDKKTRGTAVCSVTTISSSGLPLAQSPLGVLNQFVVLRRDVQQGLNDEVVVYQLRQYVCAVSQGRTPVSRASTTDLSWQPV